MTDKSILQNITDPLAIEQESFVLIDAEVPEPRPFEGYEWEVVRRMIHTTADFELLQLVQFSPGAVDAGLEALRAGSVIVTDTNMAKEGIVPRRMDPLGCTVQCLIKDPRCVRHAQEKGTTRARAAMDIATQEYNAPIVAIGNAPTALIRLIELVESGKARPSLVVGMPVGFVNAAESKELLQAQTGCAWITIQGRKGGSALAASVVNALAEIALRNQD